MSYTGTGEEKSAALLRYYEQLLTIRRCEERLQRLSAEGEVPGFIHLGIGQEAISVGVMSALGPADTIASTHRGHGHALAKGMPLEGFFAELLARDSGVCRGRGGSMHVADMSVGMLGANGIVGAGLSIATGSALAHKLKKTGAIAVSFFGDGALAEGLLHECANMAALMPALDAFSSPESLGLGARHITVSTVGLPVKIREFARTGKQYHLAISLHAPNDSLRDKLVPVNNNIGVDAILAAADDYFEQTGRRVTFEYVLLAKVNDEPKHAYQLATLLRGRCAHVNLIPMNGVSLLPYEEPAAPRTQQFVQILEAAGIPATVRKRKGADIDAACGQLRLKYSEESHAPDAATMELVSVSP